MKSSAVKARMSETVDEMRRPVAMYGTRARQRDPARAARSRPTPNERAGVDRQRVDVADAVHRLHEQRPERAERGEEDLALQGRAEREEEQRDQHGRRDRAQELDRHAERARGEVARAEERSRAAPRARSRSARPSAQPRTV